MSFEFFLFCRTVENIALAVCITKAAIAFDRWAILWFLLLVFLNHSSISLVRGRASDEDEEESEDGTDEADI